MLLFQKYKESCEISVFIYKTMCNIFPYHFRIKQIENHVNHESLAGAPTADSGGRQEDLLPIQGVRQENLLPLATKLPSGRRIWEFSCQSLDLALLAGESPTGSLNRQEILLPATPIWQESLLPATPFVPGVSGYYRVADTI